MSHRRRGRRPMGRYASSAPRVQVPVPSMVERLESRVLLSTYMVTNTLDSGPGSLRNDIVMSNAAGGANTITWATELTGTITLTSGQLEISNDLTITSVSSLAISGNNTSRVFQVDAGVTVTISGLTITGGRAPDGTPGVNATNSSGEGLPGGNGGDGGGIYNLGSLTLSNDTISNNAAGVGGNGGYGYPTLAGVTPGGNGGVGGNGGGIYSLGSLTLSGDIIVKNAAGFGGDGEISGGPGGHGGDGGGIYSTGSVDIFGSTIDSNSAGGGGSGYNVIRPGGNGGDGGGVWVSGNIVTTDSTISNNRAGNAHLGGQYIITGSGGSGGGVYASAGVTFANCTVALNLAGTAAPGKPPGSVSGPGIGTGIDSVGLVHLANCTVSSEGTSAAEDVAAGGNSVLQNTIVEDFRGSFTSSNTHNLLNEIADLAPLGNYGGRTQTMPPLPGSPAIDAGSNALALSPDGTPLVTDQRGFARVVDATHTGTPTVDIGAVEVAAFPTSPFVVTTTANPALTDYGPNQLSFQQAIVFANVLGGPATITFAPGLSGNISGNFVLPDTTGKVTIQGPGANVLTIGGLQIRTNAEIDSLGIGSLSNSGTLGLNGVSIPGLVTNNGTIAFTISTAAGGISNNGTITFTNGALSGLFTNSGAANLTNVMVSSQITNSVSNSLSLVQCMVGGPIHNSGTLSSDHSALAGQLTNDGVATISNSSVGTSISSSRTLTLADSTLTGTLGDGLDNSGTATLTDCTVSGSHGIGIMNATGGSLTISGGSVTGNSGGGVSGSATILNCQIRNNGGVGVSGPTLALTNCTISSNKGDGIDATGNLGADGCTIQGNTGRGVNEAAGSSVVLNDCTIAGNQSPGSGGGIYNPAGATLTLVNSTISNNTATAGGGLVPQASGGGIENSGTALLANCTIAGNVASAGAATGAEISGGGIDNSGTLRLTNCTVANNSANAGTSPTNDANGGGIYIAVGHVTLNNTIVAGNYTVPPVGGSSPDDLVGAVGPSTAYNLIGDASAATGLIAANHNQLGSADAPIDGKLGPLANNGGPTQTMALLSGSPAIDAGSNALAVGPDGKPLLGDQRGFGRIFNGTVDIGAYEFGASLLGDANGDGKVDFADLVLVARNYGKTNATWSDGDFNNDGSVGFDDLLTVARIYGKSVSLTTTAATFSAFVVGVAPTSSARATPFDVALPHHRRRP